MANEEQTTPVAEEQGDQAPTEEIQAAGTDTAPEQQVESSAEGDIAALQQENQQLKQELENARKTAEDNWNEVLRAKAELENFRRRAERDKEDIRKFGIEKFAMEMLPVKDSIEMGLQASEDTNADLVKIKEGLELTLKVLQSVMEKFNINEINPLGESFDPDYHEAMSVAESEQQAPNTVLMVFQKGYLLNERLIRSAKVVVTKAPEKGAEGDESDSDA